MVSVASETCPGAAVKAACWWPRDLPNGGQQNCPRLPCFFLCKLVLVQAGSLTKLHQSTSNVNAADASLVFFGRGRHGERHRHYLSGEDVVVSVDQLDLHLVLTGRQPGYVDCVVVTRIRPPPGQVVELDLSACRALSNVRYWG